MDTNNEINLFDLQVDHESSHFLKDAAKWAKFLAILGFIWCGFFLVWVCFQLFRSGYTYIGAGAVTGLMAVYVVIVVLFFFPCLYLYNFARKMQRALYGNDQEQMNASLKNLRASFRFMGIMSIVWLALAVTGFIYTALIMRQFS